MVANQTTTRITGVGTIGIPVRDQGRALEFYTEKLGLEIRVDTVFGRERWIEVAPPGSTTTLALLRGPDQVRMGVDTQVRLATDDAEAVHADLQARGVDVDMDMDAMIVRYPVTMFTLRDPDGNRIVIVEQPKDR
jgi:catechol 2,3-dioxygenase-like lactoylglutathione lyase family enzyme